MHAARPDIEMMILVHEKDETVRVRWWPTQRWQSRWTARGFVKLAKR